MVAAPTAEAAFPFPRHFGQHIDTGPNIFASFRIMRRGAVHRLRPSRTAREVPAVEFFDTEINFRSVRISSDFVDGYQWIVYVKRRVFEAFGHDWPCELLPPHNKVEVITFPVLEIPGRIDKQDSAKEIKCRA